MIEESSTLRGVVVSIVRERLRQDLLKAEGRFKHTCADPELSNGDRLAILTEELGEVARCVSEEAGLVSDTHKHSLREELIQVAAIAAAWAEGIDIRSERGGSECAKQVQ